MKVKDNNSIYSGLSNTEKLDLFIGCCENMECFARSVKNSLELDDPDLLVFHSKILEDQIKDLLKDWQEIKPVVFNLIMSKELAKK